MDYQEIATLIATSKKKTPVKVYVKGRLKGTLPASVQTYTGQDYVLLVGDWEDIAPILQRSHTSIEYYHLENNRRNSALPMLDLKKINARIEPGAIIREKVTIGRNCIIMMGAVINIGVVIKPETMIDMNAVIGARAMIGKKCHIGAGAVIAGVLEPPSAHPVTIGDSVLVGANAVILEGVRVGRNAVIAAGAIVTKDVKANTVVAGVPARYIKQRSELAEDKASILEDLRTL